MLSDDEKKEFSEKVKKLVNDQSAMRHSYKNKKEDLENKSERFSAINKIYEFISMIFVMAFGGYFFAKYTNTLPWSMIAISLSGFVYAFYRLYKSVVK
jgi:F0F1-type ATP synthase assembly protein I